MRFEQTEIEGVRIVRLDPIRDDRGFFARAWARDEFERAGLDIRWEQANLAHNPAAGTLRGMHFQRDPHAEWKLVRCTRGRLQDVAVDLRTGSATRHRWVGTTLDAAAGDMLLIPPGCAHGYLTLEADTDLFYQTSAAYDRDVAGGVRHDDPAFGIAWSGPVAIISEQDRSWPLVAEA
jgi:dTDP-4-dehydrorhamnose 3,5-epimerase